MKTFYINDKLVAPHSVKLDGVRWAEYPEFVDSYYSYAEFDDGTELDEDELTMLYEVCPPEMEDFINYLADRTYKEEV